MPSDLLREFAPAKINLTLHVTGQRGDGYHLLDSLVAFAEVGDVISGRAAEALSLKITGPQAAQLPLSDDNLVLRAARLMGATAEIGLKKTLPIASGIGGGSADAAATLRLLAQMQGKPLPTLAEQLLLGADVPVCVAGQAVRMQGVGEQLSAVPQLPEAWLVLINPGVEVSTPAVFKGLAAKDNAPMPAVLPDLADVQALADFLAQMRNDLEAPALALVPKIKMVKSALEASDGCYLARMSGSGATCFGLYADEIHARRAVYEIEAAHAEWWIAAGRLLTGPRA